MSEQPFKICANERCAYARPSVDVLPFSNHELKEVLEQSPETDNSKASPMASFWYGREVTPVQADGTVNITWTCGPVYLVLRGEDGSAIRLDEDQIDRLSRILDRGLFPKEECPVTTEIMHRLKLTSETDDQERKS